MSIDTAHVLFYLQITSKLQKTLLSYLQTEEERQQTDRSFVRSLQTESLIVNGHWNMQINKVERHSSVPNPIRSGHSSLPCVNVAETPSDWNPRQGRREKVNKCMQNTTINAKEVKEKRCILSCCYHLVTIHHWSPVQIVLASEYCRYR